MFSRAVQKILGGQLLSDLSGFVGALDSTFGGFRQRAEQTYRILQDPQTAFLVVAAPEPDAIREAGYFAGRLAADRMPLQGLVLNRVHATDTEALPAGLALTAAQRLERSGEHLETAGALRIHAQLVQQVQRESAVAARFTDKHPQVPVAEVPAQPADVHDIDGLRGIATALCSRPAAD